LSALPCGVAACCCWLQLRMAQSLDFIQHSCFWICCGRGGALLLLLLLLPRERLLLKSPTK
jgi:hypothetical protein